MAVIPNGYGQVTMGFGGGALQYPAAITFGVFIGTADDPGEVALKVRSNWEATGIESQLVNSITQDEITVKFGPNATGPSSTIVGAGPGTSAIGAAPPNVALLVQKRTEFGGKSGRGRFYIPGIPETQVNADGSLVTGYVTGMQNVFDDFVEKLQVDGTPMVVFHNPGAPLTTPSPVIALEVQSVVATQRRRLRR